MKTLFSNRFPFFARLQAGTHVAGSGKSHRVTLLLILPLMAGMLCVTSLARADDYNFSVTGSGIAGSGTLQVSNTGPFGAYTVTGITGTFTDTNNTTNNNSFSGAITGLNFAPAPTTDNSNTYFSAPAFTTSGFSYDNLFWPGGNSPAAASMPRSSSVVTSISMASPSTSPADTPWTSGATVQTWADMS